MIFHNFILFLEFYFISQVEVLETYSTPRDFKQRLSQHEEEEWEREYAAAAAAAAAAASVDHRSASVDDAEQKCFTSPDREYSQPYTTGKL